MPPPPWLGQFTDLSGGRGGEGVLGKKEKKRRVVFLRGGGGDTPMQTMQDVFGQVKELLVA